jgi:hypothetical protein
MDVMLLKRYDKAQDINALYKEILRNCNAQDWYWHIGDNVWRSIDRLEIRSYGIIGKGDYILCATNDNNWAVEKWLNLT